MKYIIITDENDYIVSMYEDPEGIELPEDFDFSFIGCYKLIDNEIVLDEDKLTEIEEEEEKNAEILVLQNKLNNSDYIVVRAFEDVMSLNNPLTFVADVIKIMVKYSAQYKEQLVERKTWRERIEELQGGK